MHGKGDMISNPAKSNSHILTFNTSESNRMCSPVYSDICINTCVKVHSHYMFSCACAFASNCNITSTGCCVKHKELV